MGDASSQKIHLLLFVAILLLVVNMAVLNYKIFAPIAVTTGNKSDGGFNIVSVATPSGGKQGTNKIVDSCYPYSCVDLIRQATASSSEKEETITQTASTSNAKEFYVPLGSGQTTSDQWEDVPGLTAYIDSTKYGKIKTVTFEASMRIPTANGRVYAQLFNTTDAHPVWFSEVSMEGNKSQFVISSPITLDSGNKLYKVQMKTTLKYQSILDLARVHIITE